MYTLQELKNLPESYPLNTSVRIHSTGENSDLNGLVGKYVGAGMYVQRYVLLSEPIRGNLVVSLPYTCLERHDNVE